MKHSLTILLILFCLHSSATDYYFSNAGNDGNLGTQASPYATITKLNTLTLAAGDHVYFRRGDTFYGKIRINRFLADYSSPVTIGAYGTGANPIITGLSTVTGWNNLGSNIWESSSAVSTLSELNIVLINGVNTPMGRYPNDSIAVVDGGLHRNSHYRTGNIMKIVVTVPAGYSLRYEKVFGDKKQLAAK